MDKLGGVLLFLAVVLFVIGVRTIALLIGGIGGFEMATALGKFCPWCCV